MKLSKLTTHHIYIQHNCIGLKWWSFRSKVECMLGRYDLNTAANHLMELSLRLSVEFTLVDSVLGKQNLIWNELNWTELNWPELNWTELNWIELNWNELNWIELNWIELNDWTACFCWKGVDKCYYPSYFRFKLCFACSYMPKRTIFADTHFLSCFGLFIIILQLHNFFTGAAWSFSELGILCRTVR